MRYLMLLTNPTERVEQWKTLTTAEAKAAREAELPKWGAFVQWAGEQGLPLSGLELDEPRTAKVLRAGDNGRAAVTDGPFPETKEVIGGYFIVTCDDLDQAIDIASRIPVAESGSVEIHPLLESQ